MSPAGGLSREALERIAAGFPPAERARIEAEIAAGRAALKKRHADILAAASREAAIAARAALGAPEFQEAFERAKALRRASVSAARSFARAHRMAERLRRSGR